MKKFLLMNFAFLILLSFAFAEEEKSTAVIVSGYGLTEEDALKNAFAAAVEQAVGTLVSSTLLVENSELVNEKILSLSNGFIETYKKLSTTKQGGFLRLPLKPA
jgi:hypothetical protein